MFLCSCIDTCSSCNSHFWLSSVENLFVCWGATSFEKKVSSLVLHCKKIRCFSPEIASVSLFVSRNVFDHIRLLREAFTDNCTYGLILTFCGSFLVLLSLVCVCSFSFPNFTFIFVYLLTKFFFLFFIKCGLYDKMNLLRTIEELGIFPFCSSFCAFIFIFSIFRLVRLVSSKKN